MKLIAGEGRGHRRLDPARARRPRLDGAAVGGVSAPRRCARLGAARRPRGTVRDRTSGRTATPRPRAPVRCSAWSSTSAIRRTSRSSRRRAAGAENDCSILIADANEFVRREDAYQRLLLERRVDGVLLGTLMPTTETIAAMRASGCRWCS